MQRPLHRLIGLMLVIVLTISITSIAERAEAQDTGQVLSGPITCQRLIEDANIADGMRRYTFGVRGAQAAPGQNIVGTVTFADGGVADGGGGIAFGGFTLIFSVTAPPDRQIASVTVGPVVEVNPGTAIEFVGPNCSEAPAADDDAFDMMLLNFAVEPSGTADTVCLISASATFTGSEQSAFDVIVIDTQGQRTLVGRADASNNHQPGGYQARSSGLYDIEFASVATGAVRTITGVNCPEPTAPTPTPTTPTTASTTATQATPACINSSLVQGRADLQDKRVGFEFFDADNRARVITAGSSCKFNCQEGLDMNCDDQLFDTCPANLDANLVSGANSCLQALSASGPTTVPTPAPTPTVSIAGTAADAEPATPAGEVAAAPRPSFTG